MTEIPPEPVVVLIEGSEGVVRAEDGCFRTHAVDAVSKDTYACRDCSEVWVRAVAEDLPPIATVKLFRSGTWEEGALRSSEPG